MTKSGKDTLETINRYLRALRKEARIALVATGADHIVYGVKYYGTNGSIDRFALHMMAMSDTEFEEKIVPLKKRICIRHPQIQVRKGGVCRHPDNIRRKYVSED